MSSLTLPHEGIRAHGYGRIVEKGSREYTLDGFYVLPLGKLDRSVCLKKSEIVIDDKHEESGGNEDDIEDEDVEDADNDKTQVLDTIQEEKVRRFAALDQREMGDDIELCRFSRRTRCAPRPLHSWAPRRTRHGPPRTSSARRSRARPSPCSTLVPAHWFSTYFREVPLLATGSSHTQVSIGQGRCSGRATTAARWCAGMASRSPRSGREC